MSNADLEGPAVGLPCIQIKEFTLMSITTKGQQTYPLKVKTENNTLCIYLQLNTTPLSTL